MVQFQPASSFSFLFLTLHLALAVSGVHSATFTLVNQCNYTVWPASLTDKSGDATLSPPTGFVLKPGANSTVTRPAGWTGRFWGRTLCTTDSATGNFSCVTGDCGTGKLACDGRGGNPPATLTEFALTGVNGLDYYDVSLVDGYNVPMEIVPLPVNGSGSSNCNSTGCPADLNAVCPTELKKVTENGTVVACQGPCAGNRSTLQTCGTSVDAQIFKRTCPQAYSYAYDDNNKTFTCSAATNYRVIFCPASNNTSSGSLDQGVSVGDSLTAGNGTTRWLSPSRDFAFGFYQLPSEFFLLAIWYDKIPNKTIIWYANGDIPAPRGSRLELNDSHGLVLSSP